MEKNCLKIAHTRGKGCPHSLLLQRECGIGLQVLGAPKINPEVGRIVYNPIERNMKYIRCVCHFLNIEKSHLVFLGSLLLVMVVLETPAAINAAT